MWDTKRAFHEAVVNSGVEYTIISNGVFFETFFTPLFGFDRQKREARAPAATYHNLMLGTSGEQTLYDVHA